MKRRTLDIIFSIGGLMLAVLVLMLGVVLRSNAVFAKDYVRDQLTEQRITFTPAENLSPEEQQSAGLVRFAGQPLVTGSQAQVYANDYIGPHLAAVNDGQTYSETSGAARAARAAATEATDTGAANAADLGQEATVLEGKVQTLFRGETLRGLLLTAYGFSVFGEKAMLAAWVCFIAGFVLLLAAAAGFVHAFRTSKSEAFAPVETPVSQPVAVA
jgi:uncharacterized membrane protein